MMLPHRWERGGKGQAMPLHRSRKIGCTDATDCWRAGLPNDAAAPFKKGEVCRLGKWLGDAIPRDVGKRLSDATALFGGGQR
jgi:hypothetical protein